MDRLFRGQPKLAAAFTQPVAPGASSSSSTPASTGGYITTRIRAFIRAVQTYFTVSSVPSTPQLAAPGSPPTFDVPPNDLITEAMSSLGAGVTFGSSLTSAQIASAAQSVFSTNPDPVAQAWLQQALTSINDLWTIAQVVPEPNGAAQTWPVKANFTFSVVEALYARGFRCAKDITDLTAADFKQAMTGTVAFDYANPSSGSNSLYLAAQNITHATPPTVPAPGPFQPVNPGGTLVNCVPPPCLSPTGPVAYLQEMLNLSEAATCENPNPSTGTTLGAAVAARRGPLANLLASCANLETPLPLIDIVNESLEYLGATQPPPAGSTSSPPSGTVYNTSADQVAGYTLCRNDDCAKDDDHACLDPAQLFTALPEYSTPAIPTATNGQVEPLVFNDLKTDFSACCLPYSQALDVAHLPPPFPDEPLRRNEDISQVHYGVCSGSGQPAHGISI